jgi:hypothetical protein
MVRMFGYVGAARLKERITPLTVSLAAGALVCFALAMFSRHVSHLRPLRPYELDFQLAGFVLSLLEIRAVRRRDAQLMLTTETEM